MKQSIYRQIVIFFDNKRQFTHDFWRPNRFIRLNLLKYHQLDANHPADVDYFEYRNEND